MILGSYQSMSHLAKYSEDMTEDVHFLPAGETAAAAEETEGHQQECI